MEQIPFSQTLQMTGDASGIKKEKRAGQKKESIDQVGKMNKPGIQKEATQKERDERNEKQGRISVGP